MSGRKISLRMRIWLTRLEYAVTRLESAVTIALIVIALPAVYLLGDARLLLEGVWVTVLVIGVVAEGLLIASSMSDHAAGAREVCIILHAHFGIPEIVDVAIREQVAKAIEYRRRMEEVLGGTSKALRGTISGTVDAVDRWIRGIGRLANRLDQLQDNTRSQSADKFQLRERIDDLEKRTREVRNGKVQQQLRETIAGHKREIHMIEELESLMESGELRLEHAVAALGTIYMQLTIFAFRGMEEGGATILSSEISSEIDQVNAVLDAMDRISNPVSGQRAWSFMR